MDERRAERPEIGLRGRRRAAAKLGCAKALRERARAGTAHHRRAEIEEDRAPAPIDLHVRGLEISVDEACAMERGERLERVGERGDEGAIARRRVALPKRFLERHAFDEVFDEERSAGRLVEAEVPRADEPANATAPKERELGGEGARVEASAHSNLGDERSVGRLAIDHPEHHALRALTEDRSGVVARVLEEGGGYHGATKEHESYHTGTSGCQYTGGNHARLTR